MGSGAGLSHTYDADTFIRMQKLTLSVDRHVIARAKVYARNRGTSVSRLVESMLDVASRASGAPGAITGDAPPPVLTRLRGSLKKGSAGDYQRHLEQKYK